MKLGASINVPPYFGGGCDNYATWKIYMQTFLCSQDELMWIVVVDSYTTLVITDEKKSKTTPKP